MNTNNLEVSNLLRCQLCGEEYSQYDSPRMLPCGKTVCDNCVSIFKRKSSNDLFRCDLCLYKHLMPNREVFPLNHVIITLLKQQKQFQKQPSLDQQTQETDLNVLIDEMSYEINNGEFKIKEHCNSLRKKVASSTEHKINRIKEINESILQKINDYENVCLRMFNSNNELKQKIKALTNDTNKLVRENKEFMKKFHSKTDEEKIEQLNEKFKSLKSNINYYLFNKEILEFESNENKIDESLLGILKTKEIQMNELNIREHANSLNNYVTYIQVIDENSLVCGSSKGEIKALRIDSGKCFASFEPHTKDVLCLCLLPGNERFISGSKDGTMKVFDIVVKYRVAKIDQKYAWITQIKVLDNKYQFLSANSDGLISIYEINSWTCMYTINENSGWLYSLQLMPNNRIIFGSDSKLKIWDLNSNTLVKELKGHSGSVFCIQVVSNKIIISAAYKEVNIWNIESGKLNRIKLFTQSKLIQIDRLL